LESERTGEDIGYGAALVRWIVSFASFAVLYVGYLWVIWDGKNQTWHDKAAGSVVVVHRSTATRPPTVARPPETELHDLDIRKRMQERKD
jgi:uncharacterized RDD family membrane protein YckC